MVIAWVGKDQGTAQERVSTTLLLPKQQPEVTESPKVVLSY